MSKYVSTALAQIVGCGRCSIYAISLNTLTNKPIVLQHNGSRISLQKLYGKIVLLTFVLSVHGQDYLLTI